MSVDDNGHIGPNSRGGTANAIIYVLTMGCGYILGSLVDAEIIKQPLQSLLT